MFGQLCSCCLSEYVFVKYNSYFSRNFCCNGVWWWKFPHYILDFISKITTDHVSGDKFIIFHTYFHSSSYFAPKTQSHSMEICDFICNYWYFWGFYRQFYFEYYKSLPSQKNIRIGIIGSRCFSNCKIILHIKNLAVRNSLKSFFTARYQFFIIYQIEFDNCSKNVL